MSSDTTLTRRTTLARIAQTTLGVGLLPSVFTSKAGAAFEGASTLKQVPTAKNVIYLYMAGGMSHLDTWDPKPKSEFNGSTTAIPTKADDVFVSDSLPRTAALMDRIALVRSMNSTQGAHQQGNYFMHTSYGMRGTIKHPAMGAWLLRMQGRDNPTIPGSVVIGGASNHPGSGFFEAKYAPLMVGDPETGLQNSKRRPGLSENRFDRRLSLAQELDAKFHEKVSTKNTRAYADLYDEAVKLMESRDLAAFDLTKESRATRDSYGRDKFGQGCLLARRLVEHSVRFVEVSLGGWDTHVDNFNNVPVRAETLDRGLATLIADLESRGLLDETLVVVATEFGRTPKINVNDGRDHYPSAFTCLMAGGGVQGGTVVGSTDENGAEVASKKTSIPDFNATIAYALGMPLDQIIFSPSKRPFTITDKGQPILEIFG